MKVINDVKFLIVGLGLIGGSYAQALTDLGYEVGAVTRSQKSIDYAKDHGLFVAFSAEDATRTDIEFLKRIYSKAQECGADRVHIADTTGAITPQGIDYLVKELVKDIQKIGENSKVAVRSIRRDCVDKLKAMKKASEITEDDLKDGEKDVQKITDNFIKEVDDLAAAKAKEIMEI